MELRYILVTILILKSLITFPQKNNYKEDSLTIDKLLKTAYDAKLSNPKTTLKVGYEALRIATEKQYQYEIAEASRILGIGYYNLNKTDSAIVKYYDALDIFKKLNNLGGQAQVYNNIGNLYREVDLESGLKHYQTSLNLALKSNMQELIGGSYLNIGIIHYRKKNYKESLLHFDRSFDIFRKIKNETGQILCLQNKGVVLHALKQYTDAEKVLTDANEKAKKNHLNKVVGGINLTLAAIYMNANQFDKSEAAIREGILYSKLAKNKKLERDYTWRSYELESKRSNYKQALKYLNLVYTIDSADYGAAKSDRIVLLEEQSKLLQKEKENQIIIERQKKNQILLFAAIIVSILSFIVIFLLIKNVKKKAKTNHQLKLLNEEISVQKENLNTVNQNLEKIIDERTKDLQIKNRKLSEYSSHLSHQIRGPVATMKGLMILEQENLIDDQEFITEIGKCVNEVDDRIININDVLHNLSESGLIPRVVDKETKS